MDSSDFNDPLGSGPPAMSSKGNVPFVEEESIFRMERELKCQRILIGILTAHQASKSYKQAIKHRGTNAQPNLYTKTPLPFR